MFYAIHFQGGRNMSALSDPAIPRHCVVNSRRTPKWALLRACCWQRNRCLAEYVSPTHWRPNVRVAEPKAIIQRCSLFRPLNPQLRRNNGRVAPYPHFLRAFFFFLVLVDCPLLLRLLDQIGFCRSTAVPGHQSKVISQNPVHRRGVIGLNRRLVLSI